MKIKTMMAILALGVSALAVNAQDAGGPPPDDQRPPNWDGQGGGPGGPGGHRPPSPLLQALDVNHDGVIDADEIENASAALRSLDKNGDGKLTPDELRPARPPQDGDGRPPGSSPGDLQDASNTNSVPDGSGPSRHGHRPPPSPLFLALDANHDGVIDADEIANASNALKTLDKNGDGKLTQDELRPPQDGGNDRPSGSPPGEQQDNNSAPNGPPPGNH
jgi:hypothetical protein